MFEKEAKAYKEIVMKEHLQNPFPRSVEDVWQDGAEYGYNKTKEEMQVQDYSLGDFVMQYEDGKFKCKDKSGKVFESVDGKTWKEIEHSKESEIKSEMFPEIILPEGSAEFVDKVIADTEKRLKEIE